MMQYDTVCLKTMYTFTSLCFGKEKSNYPISLYAYHNKIAGRKEYESWWKVYTNSLFKFCSAWYIWKLAGLVFCFVKTTWDHFTTNDIFYITTVRLNCLAVFLWLVFIYFVAVLDVQIYIVHYSH